MSAGTGNKEQNSTDAKVSKLELGDVSALSGWSHGDDMKCTVHSHHRSKSSRACTVQLQLAGHASATHLVKPKDVPLVIAAFKFLADIVPRFAIQYKAGKPKL